jgi:hypothetical protein
VYLQEQLFAAITGALNAGYFKTQNALFFFFSLFLHDIRRIPTGCPRETPKKHAPVIM